MGSFSSPDIAAVSFAVRKHRRLPDPRRQSTELIQQLVDLVDRQRYDLIVPAGDNGLAATSTVYDRLATRVQLGCPPPDIVDLVLCKDQTLAIAGRLGIPIPRSHVLRTAADAERLRGELEWPVFVKPCEKRDTKGFKAQQVDTFNDLAAILARSNPECSVLVQDFCPGYGVGIETLMHKGEAVVLFQHRRLKELPATGGVSVLAVSEPVDSTLAAYAVDLLKAIHWEGPAMVEFRRHPHSHDPILMEVNGRYWGSLPLTCRAGVDIPFYQWQLAHGATPRLPASYRLGVRCRWLAGDVKRLRSVLSGPAAARRSAFPGKRELLRFVADSGPRTHDMTWKLTDPLPATVELAQVAVGTALAIANCSLRWLLPRRLAFHLSRARSLGVGKGCAYLKLLLLRTVFCSRRRRCRTPTHVHRVLFVCHGNIIRSPLAAALMSQRPQFHVRSAGLRAKTGRPADARACCAAKELGLSLDDHAATPLNRALVDEADVIVVMDRLNEVQLLSEYPQARGKLVLLGAFAQARLADDEIVDPYNATLEETRACLRTIKHCISQLAIHLESRRCQCRSTAQ